MNGTPSRGAVGNFILHPGELTAAWVDQAGNAWWPPLRLWLACVVVIFVLSGLIVLALLRAG